MIRIYTAKSCEYCDQLKDSLNKEGFEYIEIDINDEKNRAECEKVFQFTGVAVTPIIIKKPHVLVPTRSFNTIDQAMVLIKSLT